MLQFTHTRSHNGSRKSSDRRRRHRLANLCEKHLARPFEKLEGDVTGEAVGDDDVRNALEHLPAFDVADEAGRTISEKSVCLLGEQRTLCGLLADVEK